MIRLVLEEILKEIENKNLISIRIDSLSTGKFSCWIDCIYEGVAENINEAIFKAKEKWFKMKNEKGDYMTESNIFDNLNEVNKKILDILNEKNVHPVGVIMIIHKILEGILKDHSKFLLMNNKEPDEILKICNKFVEDINEVISK